MISNNACRSNSAVVDRARYHIRAVAGIVDPGRDSTALRSPDHRARLQHLCPPPLPALESPDEFAAAGDRATRIANVRAGRPEPGISFQQSRILPEDDGVLDARRA